MKILKTNSYTHIFFIMYNNSLGQDLENVKCLKVNKM